MRGDGDVAPAGDAFWGGDDELTVDAGNGPVDMDDAALQVDVAAAELSDFPKPEATPGGKQDHRLTSLGHRADQGGQFVEGSGGDSNGAAGGAGASDVRRVRGGLPVVHRGLQNRPQQSVGVCAQGRCGGGESSVPASNRDWGDRPDRGFAKRGQDLILKEPAVVLSGTGLELSFGQPRRRVRAEGAFSADRRGPVRSQQAGPAHREPSVCLTLGGEGVRGRHTTAVFTGVSDAVSPRR
jgi:hypothetical protein